MVAVGLTLTGVPLVTAMLPGAITPEPPLNTAVKLELAPYAIVAGLAVKLVIDGGGVVSVEPAPVPQPAKLQMAATAITAATTGGKLCLMKPHYAETELEVVRLVALRKIRTCRTCKTYTFSEEHSRVSMIFAKDFSGTFALYVGIVRKSWRPLRIRQRQRS